MRIWVIFLFFLLSNSYLFAQKSVPKNNVMLSNEYLQIKIYELPENHPLNEVYNALMDSINLKWKCFSPKFLSLSVSRREEGTEINLSSNKGYKYFYFKDITPPRVGIIKNGTIIFCSQFYENQDDFFKDAVLVDSIPLQVILNYNEVSPCNFIISKKNNIPILYDISFYLLKDGSLVYNNYIDLIDRSSCR